MQLVCKPNWAGPEKISCRMRKAWSFLSMFDPAFFTRNDVGSAIAKIYWFMARKRKGLGWVLKNGCRLSSYAATFQTSSFIFDTRPSLASPVTAKPLAISRGRRCGGCPDISLWHLASLVQVASLPVLWAFVISYEDGLSFGAVWLARTFNELNNYNSNQMFSYYWENITMTLKKKLWPLPSSPAIIFNYYIKTKRIIDKNGGRKKLGV